MRAIPSLEVGNIRMHCSLEDPTIAAVLVLSDSLGTDYSIRDFSLMEEGFDG